MSIWLVNRIILLSVLAIASIASLILIKSQDKASKLISYIVYTAFIIELTAVFAAYIFQQNNPVYNVYNIIQLILYTLYFNSIIPSFKKRGVATVIITIGCISSILNLLFLQDIYTLNTIFLSLESVIIVGMCLYYFYDFLLSDTYLKRLPIHFWFTSFILFYWSFTLFHWLVGFYLMYTNGVAAEWTYHIIMVVNAITYLSFGIIFFNYRKMSKVD